MLRCIPGLEDSDADAIIGSRPSETHGDIGWMLEALPPEKLNAAGAGMTARSRIYSADIVATSLDGRAFKRVKIIVDGRQSPPVIVKRTDLTSLGWPLTEQLRIS